MALLAPITTEQAQELTGQPYTYGSYFNPFQIDGQWYISAEEVRDCVTVAWVNELEVVEVEYEPIVNEFEMDE